MFAFYDESMKCVGRPQRQPFLSDRCPQLIIKHRVIEKRDLQVGGHPTRRQSKKAARRKTHPVDFTFQGFVVLEIRKSGHFRAEILNNFSSQTIARNPIKTKKTKTRSADWSLSLLTKSAARPLVIPNP